MSIFILDAWIVASSTASSAAAAAISASLSLIAPNPRQPGTEDAQLEPLVTQSLLINCNILLPLMMQPCSSTLPASSIPKDLTIISPCIGSSWQLIMVSMY